MIPYRSYTLGKALYTQGLDDRDRNVIRRLSKNLSQVSKPIKEQKQEFNSIMDSYKSKVNLKQAIEYVQQDSYENGVFKDTTHLHTNNQNNNMDSLNNSINKFSNISSYKLLNLYQEFFSNKSKKLQFYSNIDQRRIKSFDDKTIAHSMNSISFIKQKLNLYMGYNIYRSHMSHGNFLYVSV